MKRWLAENGLFYLTWILLAAMLVYIANIYVPDKIGKSFNFVDTDTGITAYTSSGVNGNINYGVIVDEETGIQYLCFICNNQPIIIPRFTENGLYKTPE